MRKACVYALVLESSPEDYRYIGRTIETLHRRLSKHISETNVGNQTYVYRWIRKSIAQGETIKIVILEDNLTYKQSGIREIELIRHYKNIGYKLTNLTEGGDGGRLGTSGWKHTEETLAKMRGNKHKLGHKDSPKTKEKKRLSALGNKSRKGMPHLPESIERMKIAQRARSKESWALAAEKSRITRANRTPEQIQQEHERRSKAKKKR